jgi:hypothetical protein
VRVATAPDVVANAATTLARSAPMLPRIRALGYPAALVAQDELEHLPVPWDTFDVLLLGGSTTWKLGPAAADLAAPALAHQKPFTPGPSQSAAPAALRPGHRLSIRRRHHLAYAPDRALPEVLGWLADINTNLGRSPGTRRSADHRTTEERHPR